MAAVTIFRFSVYDIRNDESQLSRRWGTREGIARICGQLVENTATDIDDSLLEPNGLTPRDYDPHREPGGFQRFVK